MEHSSRYSHKNYSLSYKTHLNQLKIIEIIQCLLSDHNGIKLEINNRRITGKSPNTWRLNKRVEEEISREVKKYFELNENENTVYQNLWDAAKAVF